jgi:hypothetical protein
MNTFGILLLLLVALVGLALLAFRKSRKFGAVLFLFSLATSGYYIWQEWMWSDRSASIELADNEEKILGLMGTPTFAARTPIEVQEIRDQFGVMKKPGNCVKEYWYKAFFMPEAWAFCFDAKGKLIDQYQLASY